MAIVSLVVIGQGVEGRRLHVHRVDHAAQGLRLVGAHLALGQPSIVLGEPVRLREQRADLPEQGLCLERSLFQLIDGERCIMHFLPHLILHRRHTTAQVCHPPTHARPMSSPLQLT